MKRISVVEPCEYATLPAFNSDVTVDVLVYTVEPFILYNTFPLASISIVNVSE